MALFGFGYGISKTAGMISGLLGCDQDARKGIEAAAALLTMGVDPLGSAAALGMLGVRQAAAEGNGVCKAIVAGTTVLSVADTVASAGAIVGAADEC